MKHRNYRNDDEDMPVWKERLIGVLTILDIALWISVVRLFKAGHVEANVKVFFPAFIVAVIIFLMIPSKGGGWHALDRWL